VCQNLDVVGIKETYLAAGAYIQKKYAKKGLTYRLSATNGARSCVCYFKTKPKKVARRRARSQRSSEA